MKKSNWRKEVINEFRTNHPVADMVIGAGVAGQKVGKYLDKKITPKLNPLPNYKPIKQFQGTRKEEARTYQESRRTYSCTRKRY